MRTKFTWIAFLLLASQTLLAQDTTSNRFIGFSDGGEMVLFREDSSNFYYLPIDPNSSRTYNGAFNHPNGLLVILSDSNQGDGNRNFLVFEPFLGSSTPLYDPLEQFLASTCVTPTGRVFGITGNGGLPGEIYEYDLFAQTTMGVTSVNYTFASGPLATNLTYSASTDELWIFAGGADTLIKIHLPTLAETRLPAFMNADGNVKATYYDGTKLWIASDTSYVVTPSQSFDYSAGPGLPDYLSALTLLDLVKTADSAIVCSNDSTELRSRFQAHGYRWYHNGLPTSGTQSSFFASLPGTYRLLVQVDSSALYFMWSEEIVVQSLAISAAFTAPVSASSPVTFINTGTLGGTAIWNFGDGNTAVGDTVQHTFANSGGTFTVTLYVTVGACTDSISQVINILAGIDPSTQTGPVSLLGGSPNPFSGETRIQVRSSEFTEGTVEISNAMGQRIAVLHDGFLESGLSSFTWDARASADGLYFVRLVTPHGVLSSRLVVQK